MREPGRSQMRARMRMRTWTWMRALAWMRAPVHELRSLYERRTLRQDSGMVTSEYAVGIIAAVGLAAVLYKVLTSGQVAGELQDIVKRALSVRM